MLTEFFKNEVRKFDQEGISPLGKQIIDACLNDATIEEFAALIETKYS